MTFSKVKVARQYHSLLISVLIAILLFVGASIRHEGFGSLGVFVNLLDDNAFLGVAAVGMTFVILSGGIDLSVGAMIGLTSILSAILIEKLQWNPITAGVAVVALGCLIGSAMGVLIAFFELAPFLVTLAGMFFARGIAFTLSLDSIPLVHPWISAVSQTRLPIPGTTVGLPILSLLFIAIVLLGIYLAAMTRFGRNIYAVGGSETSARLMGLPIARTQIMIYALSGTMASLAGLMYSFYTQSGNSTAGTGLELDAIAAVVIGGTLLSGGRGYVAGTFVGTLILGMIQTIITFEANLNSWWTRIVIGTLLLVFVLMQRGLMALSARRQETLKPEPEPQADSFLRKRLTGTFSLFSLLIFVLTMLFVPATSIACPAGFRSGRMIGKNLFQLTGIEIERGQKSFDLPELPDPAPPYVNTKGEIEIYGSARYFIRYQDWNEFEKGGCYEVVNLEVSGPNLVAYFGQYTHPWDIRKYRIEKTGQRAREVLIGGSMSATNGRDVPIWPDDNINRRIYFFRSSDLTNWVRDLFPIVEKVTTGWLGHSYGGNLIQEDNTELNVIKADAPGQIAFFYEKVSDDKGASPFKTEIFAARMASPEKVVPGSEVKIMGIQEPSLPSTVRTVGGYLIEGPRPIQVTIRGQKFFIIGFSSGDFPTDSYYINFMWSRKLLGPYQAAMTKDGRDLLDLGRELKSRYGLSWVGRPSFYNRPDGSYGMLFHGVVKSILPDNDYKHWPTKYELWEFYRSLFKTSIEFDLDEKQAPVVRILATPPARKIAL